MFILNKNILSNTSNAYFVCLVYNDLNSENSWNCTKLLPKNALNFFYATELFSILFEVKDVFAFHSSVPFAFIFFNIMYSAIETKQKIPCIVTEMKEEPVYAYTAEDIIDVMA